MIRSGTTCYNDMYFAVDEAVETTTSIGIRATHGPGVFGFPTSWAPGPAECLEKNRRFLEKHTKLDNDLARYSVCPHAPYTVPEAYLIETKALCREFHVPMHIHVQETKAELEDSINGTPSSSRHLSEARCSPIEVLFVSVWFLAESGSARSAGSHDLRALRARHRPRHRIVGIPPRFCGAQPHLQSQARLRRLSGAAHARPRRERLSGHGFGVLQQQPRHVQRDAQCRAGGEGRGHGPASVLRADGAAHGDGERGEGAGIGGETGRGRGGRAGGSDRGGSAARGDVAAGERD